MKRWKGRKKDLPGPKKWNFWVRKKEISRPNTIGSCFLQRNAPILVKYSLLSPVYNLQPHIGGRHPVLYFTIQVTEKYSAAMYYLVGDLFIGPKPTLSCKSRWFHETLFFAFFSVFKMATKLLKAKFMPVQKLGEKCFSFNLPFYQLKRRKNCPLINECERWEWMWPDSFPSSPLPSSLHLTIKPCIWDILRIFFVLNCNFF